MSSTKTRLFPALPLAALLAGCAAAPRITNLTPPELPRNTNGLYRVEAEFTSRQQSLRWPDVQAFAVRGHQFFPLGRSPGLAHRWEGWLPVPPAESVVFYRFRWDFAYQGFGQARSNSVRSPDYRLEITDR